MFLWRQEDTSSLRLFSVDSSGRQMIRNFSLRQRLHLLLELLYGECDERMRQEIKCSMLLPLRVQMCLLSSLFKAHSPYNSSSKRCYYTYINIYIYIYIYTYILKPMKNENLLLTLTSLLRYAFHRCCGSSGIAKCVYRLIYINVRSMCFDFP